jgi:outer membrane protein assembly factor BamB
MITFLLALGLATANPQQSDGDWPQYMGPNGTNQVALEQATLDWGTAGPELIWKIDVGGGYGGVAIKDGRVFLLDRESGEADIMRVFDLAKGTLIWEFAYEAEGQLRYPGSRSVPAVTDNYVLTMGGNGQASCFDRKSQELVWQKNMAADYGGKLPGYGWCNSPLVLGDMVIISALGDEAGLVAFDVATGKEIWASVPLKGSSHSSPVLFELLGKQQIIFLSEYHAPGSTGRATGTTVNSYEPKTGKLNWEQDIGGSRKPIPTPVQVDDARIFVTGGYGGGSSMLKLREAGTKFELEELFHLEIGSQLHAPVLWKDHLYFLANENGNYQRNAQKQGGLTCLSLDGKEIWRTGDEPYYGRGSWILAGEHLLIQDGFNGTLNVIKPNPKAFELVAKSNVFDKTDRRDREMWAPMALVDGLLLMRSKEEMLCVNLKRVAE